MSDVQRVEHDAQWFAKTLQALDRLHVAVWVFDIDDARVLWANSAALKLWQADRLEELISRDMGDSMSVSVAKRLLQYQNDFISDNEVVFKENWTVYPNNKPTTVEALFSGIRSGSGRMCMLCEAKSDVSCGTEVLRSTEALLHTSVQITLYAESGKSLYQNPAARSVSRYTGESLQDHFSNIDLVNTLTANGSEEVNTVSRVNTSNGLRWHDITARLCTDAVTGESAWLVSEVDVSQLKAMEEHAQFLAGHDTLTKLPNRNYVSVVFQQQIDALIADKKAGCLLFIDLDRFKDVNDSLGHAAGDQLLVEVAKRLAENVLEENSVARLGGDEFLLLIGPTDSSGEITRRIEQISQAIARPISIDGRELCITPSVGAAVFPDDGNNIDSLMRQADLAMYHAKDAGRNSHSFFSSEMSDAVNARISLESELTVALSENQFITYFQPRVCVNTNQIVGAEALVRWLHPEKGMIPPNDFIPACEASGAITEVDKVVLAQTVYAQRTLSRMGFDLRMSVNLSPLQFTEPGMVDEILRVVNSAGGDPCNLELEITESVLLGNDQATIEKLNLLVEHGFKISIDDFGTGYSNLAYLHQYPLSCIKIDRSFVSGTKKTQPIVRLIISMAELFGMNVVAEGVESTEQLQRLDEYQCDEYQGYLFSKPVPLPQLIALVEKGRCQAA